MKNKFINKPTARRTQIAVVIVSVLMLTSCMFMKLSPPPDADKTPDEVNNSCYLATASNMLAIAGYGNGTTVQARTDDIYGDMVTQFGIANSGWTDAALTWWLGSTHNTWTTNPYTIVTVYGNKSPKYPWVNPDGAQDIGNELRSCHPVGLSISWPTDAINASGNPVIGSGGHAITCVGDGKWLPGMTNRETISRNSSVLAVTDSDRDTGGDVQNYTYDTYTNPNPGGANEGNGWYFDFSQNHAYIKHIATLSPTQNPVSGADNIQRVIGSYKIHQSNSVNASDLHYKVSTDAEILSYFTMVSWDLEAVPEIEEGSPRRNIVVDWDFTNKPIPKCKWVIITTEFILRNWNAIKYSDVHFTYPNAVGSKVPLPVDWTVRPFQVQNATSIPNVTGGYFIASFDIIDNSNDSIVGQYRLLHQYSFNQSPEKHTFILQAEKKYKVNNLSFGHSYGYLDQESLWRFEDWMTTYGDTLFTVSEIPLGIDIDWTGRLPYPEGEIFNEKSLILKRDYK